MPPGLELEPVVIENDLTEDERAQRDAFEMIARAMPAAEAPAPPASVLDQGLPPPPGARPVPPAREQAMQAQQQRAQGVGDAYRSQPGPPAQPSRIFRDAQGREQGRSYAPGTLPPPQAPYFPPDIDSPQPAGAAPPPPAGSGAPSQPSGLGPAAQRLQQLAPQIQRQLRPDVHIRATPSLEGLAYDDMTPEERSLAARQRSPGALQPSWMQGGAQQPQPSIGAETSPRAPSPLGGAAQQFGDAYSAATAPGAASPFVPSGASRPGRGQNTQQLIAALGERVASRPEARERGPKPPGNAPPNYTGVDTLDVIRTLLHAIGSGLRGAAGRDPLPAPGSLGEQARERDEQTASRKMAQMQSDAGARADEREMSLRERQQGALEADRSQRAQRLEAQGAAMDRYRQRSSDIAAMRADGAISEQQARTAEIQARTELFQARQNPGSDVSARARERLGRETDYRGEVTGRDVDMNAEGMSAADVERMETNLGQTRSARVAGAGNRAGGGAQSQGLTDMPAGWTGTPEAWLALSPRQRQSAISQLGMRRPAAAEGEEEGYDLIPGVRATIGGDPDARAFRTRYTQAGEAMDALGRLEAVARRAGPSARIDPTIAAEIAPDMLLLRGMAAQRQGSGVINPGELPVINAAIPDPQSLSGQLLGTLATNARVWRSSVVDGVLRHAESLGASDIEAVRRGVMTRGGSSQGGAPRAQAAPQGDTVAVIAPDGRRGRVPRARLQDAISRGYQEAP
jgi:hypothetical protein